MKFYTGEGEHLFRREKSTLIVTFRVLSIINKDVSTTWLRKVTKVKERRLLISFNRNCYRNVRENSNKKLRDTVRYGTTIRRRWTTGHCNIIAYTNTDKSVKYRNRRSRTLYSLSKPDILF